MNLKIFYFMKLQLFIDRVEFNFKNLFGKFLVYSLQVYRISTLIEYASVRIVRNPPYC